MCVCVCVCVERGGGDRPTFVGTHMRKHTVGTVRIVGSPQFFSSFLTYSPKYGDLGRVW